ncbi:HTH_Tnp_Tc3_2 domain-containing protein [Trichonephila clavipes]|nr:HTH_Tnp_Tc3_2 domain-containing protein [Trichonephila clavipes]
MQRDCALRIASRGPLTSFSVEYKTGNQSLSECAESFTKEELRPGSGRPRQTSRREDRHIRNARVQPTASSTTIQGQEEPSLGPRCLLEPYEGAWLKDIWDHGAHYVWCHARGNWTTAKWNRVVFSDANPDSISTVMTIVFVSEDPVVNVSILPLLYSDTPLPAGVMVWGAIAYNTRHP